MNGARRGAISPEPESSTYSAWPPTVHSVFRNSRTKSISYGSRIEKEQVFALTSPALAYLDLIFHYLINPLHASTVLLQSQVIQIYGTCLTPSLSGYMNLNAGDRSQAGRIDRAAMPGRFPGSLYTPVPRI